MPEVVEVMLYARDRGRCALYARDAEGVLDVLGVAEGACQKIYCLNFVLMVLIGFRIKLFARCYDSRPSTPFFSQGPTL